MPSNHLISPHNEHVILFLYFLSIMKKICKIACVTSTCIKKFIYIHLHLILSKTLWEINIKIIECKLFWELLGKESAGDQVLSLDQEDPLKKGMATHSGILAWKIPQTEDPGGLQSMGLQRVVHNWAIICCKTLKLWLSVPLHQNWEAEGLKWGFTELVAFLSREIASLLVQYFSHSPPHAASASAERGY